MAKDYRRLWKNVISTADEDKAVRTLAKILVDKEGRAFMKKLERKDAELCIEILDHVSRDPYLPPFLPSQIVSSDNRHRGVQSQDHREAGFLRHPEATCWDTWTAARFRDDNGKD